MDLRSAHIEGAILERAHLEGAELSWSHAEDAELSLAHLVRRNYIPKGKPQKCRFLGKFS